MSYKIKVELELENSDLIVVDFDVETDVVHSGLGSYEYHGAKQYDQEYSWVQAIDAAWDHYLYDEKTNKFIEKWVADNLDYLTEVLEETYDININ